MAGAAVTRIVAFPAPGGLGAVVVALVIVARMVMPGVFFAVVLSRRTVRQHKVLAGI